MREVCVCACACMFIHVHTCVNHDLHSFGLDLTGTTGNEEMIAASHKHKPDVGTGWAMCLTGEHQQPGSVSLFYTG